MNTSCCGTSPAAVNLLPLRAALALGALIGSFFCAALAAAEAGRRLEEIYGARFSKRDRQRAAGHSFRNICFHAVEAARAHHCPWNSPLHPGDSRIARSQKTGRFGADSPYMP